jgi:hypothetical protein
MSLESLERIAIAMAIENQEAVGSGQKAEIEMQDEKCKVKNAKWKKQLNFAFTNPGSHSSRL